MGFTATLAVVIGFFATARAAGADFGMNSRNESDVRWGGLVGITLAALIAGGLSLASVAGAHGANLTQGWDYDSVMQAIGGPTATAMFFLFAIASIPATCFCAFIVGNSFSTMIPGVPRVASSMAGCPVGVILRGHRCRRQLGVVLHDRGRFLWADLRRHGGRLPALRQAVGRPARRREPGWLHRLGHRIFGRHSAIPTAAA